ncbi:MAG: hypothetical protein K2X50_00725 [Gammaproteobacteria bacterium]|nr:hypothetical protein [Gammaproteobacteria bacterium]
MRKSRKNATNLLVINLENGPMTLSDKFRKDWRWASGNYQQSITTEKGVRIIVQGKIENDGSNTNLYIKFEKENGFTRSDLDDAIAFISGTGAKAKEVTSPKSGFIHDHLDDILIKGKKIEASDDSTPVEKAKETTKKRSFPISLKRTPKKSKHDENLSQVLIERKEKRQRIDLISGINTMLAELEKLKNTAKTQHLNVLESKISLGKKIIQNENNMSLEQLAVANRMFAGTLAKVAMQINSPSDQHGLRNERVSSQSNERRDSTYAHDYTLSDHDSDLFAQVLQEANEPPMFRRHTLEVKKEEFQERIDKMKVAAEGNEKLLDKINKYEQFLEESGILNKPESTSVISAELTKLEKQCQQALSIKGRQAPEPPGKK